ncbi:ABC transporter ATP-binding protein [Cohnella lubricantis]|uniref:Carnitine transport ATP-binding protein OpuCA n=1 Tax=Cohnella lubricantis TaxID=2163172 RepID=A0A841TFL6_9BACL|nr:ABC transporter ATP-binding protein [Cohnella lubricantis]MBB6678885.1 ABC transporter ATP-binding protein [Cohnella lubricantis]MBP2120210.1 putative spermidine/putrescine transport system ATP-binding protein [Cohnella lubricantis]
MSQTIDVELRQVRKTFGSNIVVDEFDLQIQEGECISFLGPSGCGKTTTLNMIAGFLEPDGGEIRIKGKRMNGVPSNKRELGMVFQTYSLFPHMTVAENVAYGLKLRKVPKAEVKQRVAKALELVKLPQVADRYPKQLSGGQRQRIAIARALVIEPSLLLLDEPLSNLDAKLREELREEIKRLHMETGVTTIFVTHDQEEALYLSDRIVVLSNGKVEQIGTPLEIYNRPATEFVHTFIGKSNKLPAVVEVQDGETLQLRADAGFKLQATAKGQKLTAGSAAHAYIRPEKLRLAVPGTNPLGANSAQGRVRQLSFLGAFAECDVEIGSATVTVRIQTIGEHAGLKPGDPVALIWHPEDVFVFPGEER